METRFNKTIVALFLSVSILILLVAAFILHSFSNAASRDYALFYSTKTIGAINTHLNREVGLMQKAVRSQAIVDWFADEDNYWKKRLAFQEMKSFTEVLYGKNLYFGIEKSLNEFSMDSDASFLHFTPYDVLIPEKFADIWYFECLGSKNEYVLNVDIDKLKQRKRVWLNIKVVSEGKALGVLSTGLQFDSVIEKVFGKYDKNNVRGLVINKDGIIQMDSAAFNTEDKLLFNSDRNILEESKDSAFVQVMTTHLKEIKGYFQPDAASRVVALSSGPYSYASIAPIEATDWTVVTFYNAASLFKINQLLPLVIILFAAFVLYAIAVNLLAQRQIFKPFGRLMTSVAATDARSGGAIYGEERDDELGDLARTIVEMRTGLNAYNTKLIEAMKRAEKASQAKSEFLANMSHEIRTPMNAIIGMGKIAKDSYDMGKIHACIGKINSASAHLLGVINDILDMAKIESGKLEIHNAAFDFEAMLKRVSSVTNFRLKEKNLHFSLSIDPAIPKRITADEQRLAQVVTNLLSNAEKFTPEHGHIAVSAKLRENDGERCLLEISVSDSGIGIPKEQHERLFRSFEQADGGISRKYGGTGLGLAICKQIVELMGGTIGLESEPGQGSRFYVIVPVARTAFSPEQAADQVFDSEAENGGTTEFLRGQHILVAEDVDINQEILIGLLEGTGVLFDFAENGRLAVEAFALNPQKYALILMDIQMPEMDGYEAARRIRAMSAPEAASIPIIAMTANVFKEDIEKSRAAGMNGHLGKPLDLDAVLRKLKDCLAGRKGLNELKSL